MKLTSIILSTSLVDHADGHPLLLGREFAHRLPQQVVRVDERVVDDRLVEVAFVNLLNLRTLLHCLNEIVFLKIINNVPDLKTVFLLYIRTHG